ncbi:MAG: hypothetical protein WKF84_11525 [Pyrinomonadaceae bacterium]
MTDGAMAVGTGDNGKIYRVRAAGANSESSLLIDVDETHVISLETDGQGNLLAGTDPGGLVLRISPDGKAFALFDAPLREIHSYCSCSGWFDLPSRFERCGLASRISSMSSSSLPSPGGGSVTVTVTPMDDGTAGAALPLHKPPRQQRARRHRPRAAAAI